EPDGIWGLAEDTDGTLLVGWNGRIHRFVEGKTEAYPLRGMAQPFRTHRLFRDRDGGQWIGTTEHGLIHVHRGKTDVFAPSDGLSGESISPLSEDREGSVWVATVNGLARFRDVAVPPFATNQGLSSAIVASVLASRDGTVWLATRRGLNKWKDGQI